MIYYFYEFSYVCILLQEKDQVREHPRAPALFLSSIFVIAVLHMLSSVVLPGVSEVSNLLMQWHINLFKTEVPYRVVSYRK